MFENCTPIHVHVKTPTIDEVCRKAYFPTASWVFHIQFFSKISVRMQMG